MKKLMVIISMLFFVLISNNLKAFDLEKDKLEASGDTIGIELRLGVTVTGTFKVKTTKNESISPGVISGIKEGDIILKFNDKKIESNTDLSKALYYNKDNEAKITILRANKMLNKTITPVMTSNSTYSLGLYIKDRILGIGTMTYIYEDMFSSLGHSIKSDSFNGGSISNAKVSKIIKGNKNKVGEKHAEFLNEEVGTISKNTDTGIHGVLEDKSNFNLNSYKVRTKDKVKKGKAYILTTINKDKVEKFEIEILEKYKQNTLDTKSMKIKVTDERLLSETGGIIQGMSGSPIIQDGYIIGAVTHVLTNDPTTGYGIYIEWMMQDMGIDIE